MIYQRLVKVFLICSDGFGLRIATMDRTQAAEIQRHLLEAADAIERAREIIFSMDEDAALSAPIEKISSALHFELLHRVVYTHYPDLRWEVDERSAIDTVRRWEEIILPESVSDADIDSIIFSTLTVRWQKTAMVVVKTLTECERVQLPVSAEMLGARIQALAQANRLDSQGDLRKWRFSEVRL